MARTGGREDFGAAARDLERLRSQRRAISTAAEAEVGVLSRHTAALERNMLARRRMMAELTRYPKAMGDQHDAPLGPSKTRWEQERRDRLRIAHQTAVEETQILQRELAKREGALKRAQTNLRKANTTDPIFQGGNDAAAKKAASAEAAISRARPRVDEARRAYEAAQNAAHAAGIASSDFHKRVRASRNALDELKRSAEQAAPAVERAAGPRPGKLSPNARKNPYLRQAYDELPDHVRAAADVYYRPKDRLSNIAHAGFNSADRRVTFYTPPESVAHAKSTMAHEAYHATTIEGINRMEPRMRQRMGRDMEDLLERIRLRVLNNVRQRLSDAGMPVQGTRLNNEQAAMVTPAERHMIGGHKEVAWYYKGDHIPALKRRGVATFDKPGAYAHEGGARIASYAVEQPEEFRKVATAKEVSWFDSLMRGQNIRDLSGHRMGGQPTATTQPAGGAPPRKPPTPRPTARADRPDDSGHEDFKREADELRKIREERERMAADEAKARAQQNRRGVKGTDAQEADRVARAAKEAQEAETRRAEAERRGAGTERASTDEIRENTRARKEKTRATEDEAKAVDHTADAQREYSKELVRRTPQNAGYNTRQELRDAEARAGLRPGPQFGDYPYAPGTSTRSFRAGPATPEPGEIERPVDPAVRDRFSADRDIHRATADAKDKNAQSTSRLTEEERRLAGALSSEQRAQDVEEYGRARRAMAGQADATKRAADMTRFSAVEFGTASQAMRRHGALTSEWIAAAARGETTMRELGFQATATIGKFAGWTAAASAVYGVVGAVSKLGEGAISTQGGVHQLTRVINNVDPHQAGQGFRQLADEFNVPIDVAADAVYRMGQRFHTVPEAMEAARSALYSFKTGEVDVSTATQNLLAVVNGFGLSAEDLTGVYDKINQAQNQFGINIGDTEAGLAKAAGTYRNAGGDLDYLLGLFVAISRATGRSGQEIGTGIARGVQRIRQPEGQRKLRAQGVDVDPENFQSTLQSAMQAARRGADVQELATGLLGNQYARLLTATLKDQTLLNEAIGPEFAKNAKGSAARELAKVLQQVDEQLRALGVSLQEMGGALAETGAFDALGGMLKLLNLSLDATVALIDGFNKLPDPIQKAVVYLGQAAAFMAIMRRFGPAGLSGRFPQLAPLIGDPATRLRTQAVKGARGQLEEIQNRRESLLRRRTAERIDIEASRGALTEWDKTHGARMEAAPMHSTERRQLARQRLALESQLQAAEAASLRSMHETNAIKGAQVRAEEELSTLSKMRSAQVVNYLRENNYPIPAEMHTPSSRGARLVGDSRTRRGPGPRYIDLPGGETGFYSPGGFTGNPRTGEWEPDKQPRPQRMYNPRYSQRWTQMREAISAQGRTFTEFLRNQSLTQKLLAPLATLMISTGNVTGHTGNGLKRVTSSEGRLRTGLRSMRTGLTGLRAAAGAIRASVAGILAGIGLLDGLFLAFIGAEIIKSGADENARKVKERTDRLKEIGTPQNRGELEEFRRLRDKQANESLSIRGVITSTIGDDLKHPWHIITQPSSTPYGRARDRRRDEAREQQEQERRDARLQSRDRLHDRPVHHRLGPEIVGAAKKASDDAVSGATTLGEFNAAIDLGIAELYRSRYVKPKDRRARRAELEQIRRTTLGQIDPTDFAARFDDAGAPELRQQFELATTRLARPGKQGDAFAMREMRAIYRRLRRRAEGAKSNDELKAALADQEAWYKAIAESMQADLDIDLGSARTERQRQRAFTHAKRRLNIPVSDAKAQLESTNKLIAEQRKRVEEAQQGLQGAVGGAGGAFGQGDALRPGPAFGNIAEARRKYDAASKRLRELLRRQKVDTKAVQDAAAARDEALREVQEQEYEDKQTGRDIDVAYDLSKLPSTDKEGRREIELRDARQRVKDAKAYHGPNRARKIKQARTRLNELENQAIEDEASTAIENARALGAINEAKAGPDPVRQAQAAAETARNVLAATNADKSATVADRRNAIAAVITAENAVDEAIRQRTIAVAGLQFDIQAARAKGDAVAEARAAQGKAGLAQRTARTPDERAQALLDTILANNQMEEALHSREEARYEFLESQTDDPVKQARLRRRAAHADVKRAPRGSEEWYRARARENQERRNVVQEGINARREDIDFNLEMEKITKGAAIAQYRSLLNTHGITKQARRDILRRIKQLQDESEQETSGFALDVGQIKLPTIYDVRRALGPVRQAAREMASPRFHSNIEVNVEVNDPGAAGHVYDAIDRALNTSVRAAARSAHMRG